MVCFLQFVTKCRVSSWLILISIWGTENCHLSITIGELWRDEDVLLWRLIMQHLHTTDMCRPTNSSQAKYFAGLLLLFFFFGLVALWLSWSRTLNCHTFHYWMRTTTAECVQGIPPRESWLLSETSLNKYIKVYIGSNKVKQKKWGGMDLQACHESIWVVTYLCQGLVIYNSKGMKNCIKDMQQSHSNAPNWSWVAA